MGNILYRDEGVGVYAAQLLREAYRFTPEVDVLDGACLGFRVIDLFQEYTDLVVLDALFAPGRDPGGVYRLPASELLDMGATVRPTAHEVEPVHMLKLAQLLGSTPDMVLIGIVPADVVEMSMGLTPEIEAAFPRFVDAAIAEIRDRGVRVEPVRRMSLGEVIDGLVTRAL